MLKTTVLFILFSSQKNSIYLKIEIFCKFINAYHFYQFIASLLK